MPCNLLVSDAECVKDFQKLFAYIKSTRSWITCMTGMGIFRDLSILRNQEWHTIFCFFMKKAWIYFSIANEIFATTKNVHAELIQGKT